MDVTWASWRANWRRAILCIVLVAIAGCSIWTFFADSGVHLGSLDKGPVFAEPYRGGFWFVGMKDLSLATPPPYRPNEREFLGFQFAWGIGANTSLMRVTRVCRLFSMSVPGWFILFTCGVGFWGLLRTRVHTRAPGRFPLVEHAMSLPVTAARAAHHRSFYQWLCIFVRMWDQRVRWPPPLTLRLLLKRFLIG